MEIRPGLKEKLFFHYEKTFQTLENILNHLGELSFYLSMNSSSIALSNSPSQKVKSIDLNRQVEYNAWILSQEIFDDFGAALSCFGVGYFKQSQSLLRGGIELTIQLWKSKLVELYGNNMADPWIDGTWGIEKMDDSCEHIEKSFAYPELKDNVRKLNKQYSRLCTATHSQKARMTAINSPSPDSTLKGDIFEPMEALYTKRTFIYTLCICLDSLILFFSNQHTDTDWKKPIIEVLGEARNILTSEYLLNNENYEKGYLVYREHIKIDSQKIIEIYSIDLDGKFIEPVRKKTMLTGDQNSKFAKKLTERILRDDKVIYKAKKKS